MSYTIPKLKVGEDLLAIIIHTEKKDAALAEPHQFTPFERFELHPDDASSDPIPFQGHFTR